MTGSFRGHEGMLARRALGETNDATVELVPERSGTSDWGILQIIGQPSGPRIVVETGGSIVSAYSRLYGGLISDLPPVPNATANLAQLTTIVADASGGAIASNIVGVFGQTASLTRGNLATFGIDQLSGTALGGLGGLDVLGLHDLYQLRAPWLDEARAEVRELLEELEPEKRTVLSEATSWVLDECARLPIGAPAIDLDPEANIELFWRTGNEGLLAIVRADKSLHLFGSSDSESWRSSYSLSGSVWRRHLKPYLKPMGKNAERA
jgi:hypothetical protein